MMKVNPLISTLVCTLALLTSLEAGAAAHERGPGNRPGHHDREHGDVFVGGNVGGVNIGATISVGDARRLAVAHRYTGYGALPPGIARNLARGKPLPPGIAKKMVPGPMWGQLPHYDGYEWRVAGTDLILVTIGTMVVAEILNDVFR